MAKMLEDKVAIVTGAGRGIGKEHALLMAKEGAKVVVNDYGGGFDGTGESKGPADEVVDEIKALGSDAVANYANVADFNEAKGIIDTAIDNFGKLNILVNNAGILRDRMMFNMSEQDFDAVIAVHLKGTFSCSRHACAYFREQHKAGNVLNGRIINTTSDAGILGNRGQANYGAAKAGIAAMTIILAMEMKKYKVTCNAVAPLARTRITTDATPQMADVMESTKEAEFDVLHPKNISPLIVYLASDDAKRISGEVFRAGGGGIWAMQGWRTGAKMVKEGTWEPSELTGKLKELVKELPKKEQMIDAVQELGVL